MQARAKLSAFEYEKKVKKVITTLKDRIVHHLKRDLTEIWTRVNNLKEDVTLHAFHLIFDTIILFTKLKDLYGQVIMMKKGF